MLRWLALVMLMAFPAQAQTVRVSSGEHADFSRIVLELPAAYDWQLGRTRDGYELAVDAASLRFDVSKVFELIPKDRLVGIFVDPATSNLRLQLDCVCYALPFSLNARTIVIDLRDGPPPDGSSFELGLDGVQLPPLQGTNTTKARPKLRLSESTGPVPQYDWLSLAPPPPPPIAAFPIPVLATVETGLRETLVAQLADGATRNVVDLAIPDRPASAEPVPDLPDSVPFRMASSLGVQIGDPEQPAAPMQPDGQVCLPDDRLSLESWITEEAAPTPYSGLATDLVGEFDKPQPDAVTAAAQRYIYLGFGAEARAVLRAFPDQSEEQSILSDLSYLVDGDPVPAANSFSGMAQCDTAAALWALLANGGQTQISYNAGAIKRAFSAMPPQLRQHIGPMVMGALVDMGDNDLATEISQTMGRAMPEDHRAMALANSELLLAEGKASEALPQVEEVMADPGQLNAEALITLVDVQIAAGKPVDAGVAQTLAAMLDEYAGHPLHADLARAYGFALAGSGQFAAARALAEEGAALNPMFWTLLAQNADDDTLLLQAMQPPTLTEDVPAQAGRQIAERLAKLGFPDAAATWQALFPDAEMLMAGATFTQPSAPETVADPVPTADMPIPVAAAVAAPTPAVEVPATVRSARWNEDWASVAADGDGTWSALATHLNDATATDSAPSLAAANESLAKSQEVRALVSTLLAETPQIPAGP